MEGVRRSKSVLLPDALGKKALLTDNLPTIALRSALTKKSGKAGTLCMRVNESDGWGSPAKRGDGCFAQREM